MAPLRPVVFDILLILNEQEMHGYAIMSEIREREGTSSILGPGTLYRVLKELMDEGLIEHSDRRPDQGEDERRRYYRITRHGKQAAAAEAARLAELVNRARRGALIN